MKTFLKYLWFLVCIRKGQLVTAMTVPVVMASTVLEESKEVTGTFLHLEKSNQWCYITGLDGDIHHVYISSIKKISTIENPEHFI